MLSLFNLQGQTDGQARKRNTASCCGKRNARAPRTVCTTREGAAEAHAQSLSYREELAAKTARALRKPHNNKGRHATVAPALQGNLAVVSHEILLSSSDASDADDAAHRSQTIQGFTAAGLRFACEREQCEQPRQQQQSRPHVHNVSCSLHPANHHNPARTARATTTSSGLKGPAAALTSQVVATVRRRSKLKGASTATVASAASSAAAPPPSYAEGASRAAGRMITAATGAVAACSAAAATGGKSGSPPGRAVETISNRSAERENAARRRRVHAAGDRGDLAAAPPIVVVVLLVAAAAALPLLARSRLPIGATYRKGYAAPPPTGAPAAAAAAATRNPSWMPYRSYGGGGAGAATAGAASAAAGSAGRWLRHVRMPYTRTAPRMPFWSGSGGGAVATAATTQIAGAVAGNSKLGARFAVAATAGNGGGGGGGPADGAATTPAGAPAAAHDAGDGSVPVTTDSQFPVRDRDYEWRESATVRVISIASGSPGPYRTSWGALADHTAQRLEWTDPAFQMLVFPESQLGSDPGLQLAFLRALVGGAQLVVGLDVAQAATESFLRDPRVTSLLPSLVLFVGGSESLRHDLTRLQGGLRPQDPGSWRSIVARKLPWTPDARGMEVWDTLQLLLGRHDSDNFLFVYLVLINQYVTTVRQVADTTKGFDLQSLVCMIRHCGSKVVGCVQDATCKGALDCLNSCTFNDQVCQYRCIVSYESPLLEQFSLCILQLHNCRNLDAKPPLLPDPAPMASFRGAPLGHAAAEDLFIGWLDQPGQGAPPGSHLGERPGRAYSWLVAAGKNPAYDYFPCQHQLFYRGRGRGQMWYEPVFKAITLDGREVWRRRVYRVRRGKVPGTFHLSVLDNGVTSNEFWRILDCEEDLAYCLFYYSGAASTAGLSYSGAVLGTPDGRMPGPQHKGRLHAALRRAGIEPWELSYVDNSGCAEAPLRITGPVGPAAAAAAVG